jgi:gas vesicle protein
MSDGIDSNVKAAGFSLGGFLLGVLVGAVAGGVTALMLAPRSGAETRGMVMDRFNQAKDVVRSSAQDMKQSVQEMRSQAH